MIARIALEIALEKEFDYLVPDSMEPDVHVGSRVRIHFGNREVLGCVTALTEGNSSTPGLKPILKVFGRAPLVPVSIINLARWIADYYCAPFELALKTAVPEAVRNEKSGWREQLFVQLISQVPPEGLTARQNQIVQLLRTCGAMPLRKLLKMAETTSQTVSRLQDKGVLSISSEVMERDPYAKETILPTTPIALNPEQAVAQARIVAALASSNRVEKPFLLFGVTGSGKTEIYLQAIEHCLQSGRSAIVLVPEISLTPQTVERFKARFSQPGQAAFVAVLHSHLSEGERHDEWQKIRSGRAKIVIGARSAIFAPVDRLGLIVVDEEHEHSYKQEETPRYHARDVAVVRGRLENAVVVLGSATPSLESFYNVQRGKYELLELRSRVDGKRMPMIRVIDMRQASRGDKGTPIFSHQLREAMMQRLERKEQTILFLNRRGFASSMQCPLCGYVAQCEHCSVSLTYHRKAQKLACHICGFEGDAPQACPNPKCRNPAIRFAGVGTERVESTLQKFFPKAVVARMDSDALKRKEDYRRILGDFRRGKIDILVGTQMIAKGLHFPNVTLVGLIYADLSLHIPDFRAGERTFQLITQVSGRAGRGDVSGEVFVQAFTPFHPAIQYARRHDFVGFYEQELEFRQQLNYPPISRIALITLKSRSEEKASFTANYLREKLAKAMEGLPGVVLAGPAAAPLAKAEGHFRFQMMLRSTEIKKLTAVLRQVLDGLALPEGVDSTLDIDPVDMS